MDSLLSLFSGAQNILLLIVAVVALFIAWTANGGLKASVEAWRTGARR